jgi:hypothetical protein
MTCLMCKNDSLVGHCPRTRSACAWYSCFSCSTVIDVARRLAWFPGRAVVRLG